MKELTNKEFASQDSKFQNACQKVGVEATPRQASKYRNKKGKAYKQI